MSLRLPEAIPHEYPFRLVERVDRIGDGRIGIVLGTADGALVGVAEWPCTLVAEALAQAVLLAAPPVVRAPRLVGIDKARMLQPVSAGDRLEVEVSELGSFGALRKFLCRAVSAGALAATVEITVAG